MDIIKLKEEEKKIRREVKERTISYILAAFGLVAGLAWNEAVKALIENFFPLSKDTVTAKFIYAISITLIAVIITIYLVRLIRKEENK